MRKRVLEVQEVQTPSPTLQKEKRGKEEADSPK